MKPSSKPLRISIAPPRHCFERAAGGIAKHCVLALFLLCAFRLAGITQAQSHYEPYVFTTLAGNPPGYADGTGGLARFNNPGESVVDSAGNIYVADSNNDTIRKITPAGVVSTLAGLSLNEGSADGTGSAARFNSPQGMAIDGSGSIYVADTFNHTIRKITPAGVVSTSAGSAGSAGSDDGMGTTARFNFPRGVAVDSAGNVYVADSQNHTIRRITPGGAVSTLAGLAGSGGSDDGVGSTARFDRPRRVGIDSVGNLYVTDTFNDTIRKITPGAVVSTFAGLADNPGSDDGVGSAARFLRPRGLAIDNANNIYVADTLNNTIRKITPAAEVSTMAGLASYPGSADGTGSVARFYRPTGVGVDGAGNLYVADTENHTIRKITPAALVSTLAGLASPGSEDGPDGAARFYFPQSVAVDREDNTYVADSNNNTIRKITPDGAVSTLAGLAGSYGSADGTGSAARFVYPSGVAANRAGNVCVADTENNTIRKITPAGVVSTLAGLAGFGGSDDGTGNTARFSFPTGVAAGSRDTVYVADNANSTIRKITHAGVVTTLAGLAGETGSADGTGSAARFSFPQSVAVDGRGNIYVADTSNHTIRKITAAGAVTTLAGSPGNEGSADGTGSAARFSFPFGIAADSAGNVFVAEFNNTVRKITPAGIVSTLAGLTGSAASADGTGSAARFNLPQGLAVNRAGRVYVADSLNNSIRAGIPHLQLVEAISRKKHGMAGDFDINLPLTGTPGVECRSSAGNQKLLFIFTTNPVSGSASVTNGTGNVSGSPTFANNTMTVNLTGVVNAQTITVALANVSDGTSTANVDIEMGVLQGDVNASRVVTTADTNLTRAQALKPVTAANFRMDVNATGNITTADTNLVKSKALSRLD